MRARRLAKKHTPVDKSVLAFGIPKRVDDERYLKTFKGETCWNCGSGDETVIPAHIRAGHEGGGGLKPGDDLTVPLCGRCHADQEGNPGPWWWLGCLKNMARRRFRARQERTE